MRNEYKDVVTSLPRKKNWDGHYLCQYQGYWFPSPLIPGIISFQKNFEAHDTDVLLSTVPKSGTAWLKALIFSVINRRRFSLMQSPLHTSGPHGVVRFIEFDLYRNGQNPNVDDVDIGSPTIFATHSPYLVLPSSVKESKCRIVYMCGNPLDQVVSLWHFTKSLRVEAREASVENALEVMCEGVDGFGPFWDHVLGYWKESVARPDKVLFLKYEDMKQDTISGLKKLADFLGFPFSEEEKKQGVMEEISSFCSFESLKDLQANEMGNLPHGAETSAFFRKGQVGDWTDYLTPFMATRVETLMKEKFSGSGSTFNFSHHAPPK